MSERIWLCGYCRKLVRFKRFFGSLHICMSEDERAEFDRRYGPAAGNARELAPPEPEKEKR